MAHDVDGPLPKMGDGSWFGWIVRDLEIKEQKTVCMWYIDGPLTLAQSMRMFG